MTLRKISLTDKQEQDIINFLDEYLHESKNYNSVNVEKFEALSTLLRQLETNRHIDDLKDIEAEEETKRLLWNDRS